MGTPAPTKRETGPNKTLPPVSHRADGGRGGDTGPNRRERRGGAVGHRPQQSARPAPTKRFRRCLTVRTGGAVGTPAPTKRERRGRGGDTGPNKARDWPQ